MSYILEALKKSEQQREIGRVPGISSVHENTAQTVSRHWLWVIVAVLLLNAGLLVVLLWPEHEVDSLAISVRQPTQATPGRPAVAPVPSQPPSPRSTPSRVPPTDGAAPDSEPPAPQAQEIARAAEPVLKDPLVKEPEMAVAPVPIQPPVPQSPGPAVRSVPPSLPVWPQIPRHLFQQLSGSLRLDVHVFSDQPAERFVLVNMQKYREGEKLQEGPQLDEITPEGMILSLGGQKFRVQAQ